MEVISVIFLGFVVVLYIAACCHIIYNIFQKKMKFNPIWPWVILIPMIGPLIYFSSKHER
jgi:hypothetical protein